MALEFLFKYLNGTLNFCVSVSLGRFLFIDVTSVYPRLCVGLFSRYDCTSITLPNVLAPKLKTH